MLRGVKPGHRRASADAAGACPADRRGQPEAGIFPISENFVLDLFHNFRNTHRHPGSPRALSGSHRSGAGSGSRDYKVEAAAVERREGARAYVTGARGHPRNPPALSRNHLITLPKRSGLERSPATFTAALRVQRRTPADNFVGTSRGQHANGPRRAPRSAARASCLANVGSSRWRLWTASRNDVPDVLGSR
jgi:hypothetical protein